MTVRKREMLFATMPADRVVLIRELVSFRARISVIAQLVPDNNAIQVARQVYSLTEVRAPSGNLSPCNYVLDIYRGLTARMIMNTLCAEFMDLRLASVPYQTSLICVYRAYRQKIGWPSSEVQHVLFDHWYSVALEIETCQSKLMRCTGCGSRNLLTKLTAVRSLECIFCDLIEKAENPTQRATRPLVGQKKVA